MKQPRLSILIPSIQSRTELALALIKKIQKELPFDDVEILMLLDNKQKSIGEKRENLVQCSTGKFFMFLDDDDDFENLIDVYNASLENVDVISFKSLCRNNDGSHFIVTHRLKSEVEHNCDENGRYTDCNRPPFHNCAWNSYYKKFHFPFVNYGEDWGWLKQFVSEAKNEYHIDKVIYKYNFDINISEASTESNSEWKNPN
jgi:hypothetical protein